MPKRVMSRPPEQGADERGAFPEDDHETILPAPVDFQGEVGK